MTPELNKFYETLIAFKETDCEDDSLALQLQVAHEALSYKEQNLICLVCDAEVSEVLY